MTEVFRTIIVPAADVAACRLSCADIDGGSGMFVAGVTTNLATGAGPATHYISSGTMDELIPALMWSAADVSEEDAATAMARVGVRPLVFNDD